MTQASLAPLSRTCSIMPRCRTMMRKSLNFLKVRRPLAVVRRALPVQKQICEILVCLCPSGTVGTSNVRTPSGSNAPIDRKRKMTNDRDAFEKKLLEGLENTDKMIMEVMNKVSFVLLNCAIISFS